jgi:hypothetical protein
MNKHIIVKSLKFHGPCFSPQSRLRLSTMLSASLLLFAYGMPGFAGDKLLSNNANQAKNADTAAKTTSTSSAEKTLKQDELRLDLSEDAIGAMQDFAYFAAGHFGDKTQYMGKYPDEFGGAYAIHCRARKPFCIEVKYPAAGIERESAMKVMQRLLPKDAGKITEHDNDDLVKKDTPQAAEFFYFQNGPRTELLYAHGSFNRVIQINIWTKDG